MPPEITSKLLRLLARWDRRLRLQQSLIWGPRGVSAGLAIGIIGALLARVQPWLLPADLAALAGLAALLGLVLALVIVWAVRRDTLQTARAFDRRFALKERVSTALELAAGRIRSPNAEITARQVADTLSRAERIDARAYLPLRLRRRDWAVLAALLLALAALLLIENPQNNVLAQEQALQSAIAQQAADLQDLREQIANSTELDESTRQEMLQELDDAIETLQQQELSQEEAVATLADLAQAMQDIAAQADIPPAQQQAFDQAAQELAQQSGELAQALDEGALDQAAEAMQDLAQNLGQMSLAEQQDLAQALDNAAEALAETNPDLAESLQQAAEALRQGNPEAAQQALEQAAGQLQQQQQELAQSTNDAGQQMASQAMHQANAGAQRIAQAGTGSAYTQQQTNTSGGNSPSPISGGQGQGMDSNQTGQSGQSGQGEQGQSTGEGMSAGNQGGQGMEQTQGTGGGAGDSPGEGQEGGFQASGDPISQNNTPDGQGLEEYEPIFAPQSVGGEGGPEVQIGGSDQPGNVVTNEGELVENPTGQSIVGYNEVFSDYANAANQALESDYIPLSLRDVVHDYFSSLEPGR